MSHRGSSAPSSIELVDTLHAVFGRHRCARASHAKGLCAVGRFVPTPAAARFCRAATFAAASSRATLRFSIGGGNPSVSDKSRTVRGLGVRLHPAEGVTHDLVLISEPVFFAATLESFVSFLHARIPDPLTGKPDPSKVAAHEVCFPDGARQPALLAAHAAPASYVSTPYFSNHAFRFLAPDGRATWARLVLEPEAGTRYLTTAAESTLSDDFLTDELTQRLANAPARFQWLAQLAGAGDSLSDPSQPWQEHGGERVALGTLQIDAIVAAEGCDAFVPTRLPDGIEPAEDEILLARAGAYGVSQAERR